jgi:hypothetical protein
LDWQVDAQIYAHTNIILLWCRLLRLLDYYEEDTEIYVALGLLASRGLSNLEEAKRWFDKAIEVTRRCGSKRGAKLAQEYTIGFPISSSDAVLSISVYWSHGTLLIQKLIPKSSLKVLSFLRRTA